MKRLVILGVLALLGTDAASARSYVNAFATPTSFGASVTYAPGGPWSAEVGAFSSYQRDVGFYGAVNYIQTVPVEETFPIKVSPYLGASLSTTVNLPLKASFGGSAYLGAVFPITADSAWYVQAGPSFQFFPQQGVGWGGAIQLGVNYYFGN